MKCPNCDHNNPNEALFCMKCGAKLKDVLTTTIPKLEDMHAQLQSLIPEALA